MTRAGQYEVLGIAVDVVTPRDAVRLVTQWVENRERQYICFANVHGVMEAQDQPRLLDAYTHAGLVAPDGMPLVWWGRLTGHPAVRRVYGPDLMLDLCQLAADRGYSCYFLGGAPGVSEALLGNLLRRYPRLRCAGTGSPPFRPLSVEEDADMVRAINAAAPDLLFVGLGCPKQEIWMREHRGVLEAPVLAGVGAAFDFHAGLVAQAPRWMMRLGLEWLHRLAHEPKRLWRRYLLLNPLFVLRGGIELLGRVAGRSQKT